MKYTWREEILKWSPLEDKNICIINRKKDAISQGEVHIMSYAIASSKECELLNAEYKIVIVDESFAIKNPKSKRTKSITKLLRKADRRILLSATPISNRPEEL